MTKILGEQMIKNYIFAFITALYSSSIFAMNPTSDAEKKAAISTQIRMMCNEINKENQSLFYIKQFEALILILGDGHRVDRDELFCFQKKINVWAQALFPTDYKNLKDIHDSYLAFYMVTKPYEGCEDLFSQDFIHRYARQWKQHLATAIKSSNQTYKKELLREVLWIE